MRVDIFLASNFPFNHGITKKTHGKMNICLKSTMFQVHNMTLLHIVLEEFFCFVFTVFKVDIYAKIRLFVFVKCVYRNYHFKNTT